MSEVWTPKFLCDQCPAFAEVLFRDVWTTQDRIVFGVKCHGKAMLVLLEGPEIGRAAHKGTLIVQQQRLLDPQHIQERLEETEAQLTAAAERAALYARVLKGLV